MSRQFNSSQFGLIAALTAAIIVLPVWPAAARGPENIADVAEQVIDAVVNVSTSQKVDAKVSGMPDLPPGSPMEDFSTISSKNIAVRAAKAGRVTTAMLTSHRAGSIRSAPASSSIRPG
jgi:hypothetical protein